MNVLLLGRDGQIGRELCQSLAGLGELVAWGRNDLDLADGEALREKIHSLRPDVIVNAAAYTAVDKAESEPDLAMAINGIAPGIMAGEALRLGALLVHYSTDYVFDGAKNRPYTEEDEPHPLNVYGRSKLMGERAIAAATSRFLIFRASWVYDAHGRNFLGAIRRAAAQRPELAIVDDQRGAPTWSRDIAHATAQVVVQYLAHSEPQQLSGIYHMSAQGETTWFGFAQAAASCGLFAGLAEPRALRAIATAQYPLPAKRPAYSLLSNEKLQAQFGIRLPQWEASLRECLAEGVSTTTG